MALPRSLGAFTLTIAMVSSMGACSGETPKETSSAPAPAAAAPALTVEEWRAKHEADYRREYVPISGLHLLKTGMNSAGSATTNDVVLPASTPTTLGRFILQGGAVRFEPAPETGVLLKDKPVVAAINLRDDSGLDVDELLVGDLRLVVHVSGDSRMIRVRDPNGPLAKGFLGFTWFAIDPQYRVVGRFIKDGQPKPMKVPNTIGDIEEFSSEGVVEFSLLGQTIRLRPFTTRPNRFYFVFRDASSGEETYKAARFLYSDLLADGTTVLDFNMAYNPPCAFNPYTTCPIPLAENRLSMKILAGEKRYPVDVPLPTGTSAVKGGS